MYATIVLHANLQYAEIPKDDIGNVVKKSYIPVITELLNKPKTKVVFNFTGFTLEILSNEYPEVINLLKEGIDKNKFELLGCGYAHPIFPLLPKEDVIKQIEFNEKALRDILNYKPSGFWLPELAYDPTLPKILKQKGYNYIFIDEDLYQKSEPLLNSANPYNFQKKCLDEYIIDFMRAKSVIKKISSFFKLKKYVINESKKVDFFPIELKGIGGTITALKAPRSWFILTYSALLRYPFININTVSKVLSHFNQSNGLISLYAMDLEFFGYRSYIEGKEVNHQHLSNMVTKLVRNDFVKLVLPSDYLEKNKPKKIGYMKTGSWAPKNTLDIWTKDEDNKKLERLCDEVRHYLYLLPESKEKEEIWKLLLLAENSDGRGWDPLPERRLDCFASATQALDKVKQLYHSLKD